MKKFVFAAALVAASVGATASQAADPILEPVIIAPSLFDWSGFYVGAHGGFAWGSIANEFDVDPPGPAFTTQPAFGVSGWLAGVQAGANMQTGKFVLGIEGRVAWVSASGNDAGLSGVTDTFDANWQGSALVKAGIAVGAEGRVLPYIIGGVTGLNYDYTLSTVAPAASATVNSTALGGSVGVGVEFAATEKVSISLEYLHTWYGNQILQFPTTAGFGSQRISLTPQVGTATVGVNFHF